MDDYGKWQDVYKREVPNTAWIGTLRSLDNPKMIFVIQWSDGHNEALQMVSSPETKLVLDEGTVIDEPRFQFYDVKYFWEEPNEDSLRLAVTAEVLNFRDWKSSFDDQAEIRNAAGLTLVGLATDSENSNLVFMLFATNNRQQAYTFMTAPETEAAVAKSGIIGSPNLTWWRLGR